MSQKKNKNLESNVKFINDKIIYFQDIIQNTIISSQKYKFLDILSANDINICIQNLEILFNQLNQISFKIHSYVNENIIPNIDEIVNSLQQINNELSSIIKNNGTNNLDDLVKICLGKDFEKKYCPTQDLKDKYELLSKYLHPIGYKVIPWKNSDKSNKSQKSENKEIILQKNKIIEDCAIVEHSKTLDCFDLARTKRSFQIRVYGIKLSIQDPSQKQTLIISGVVDDILLDCINNNFLSKTLKFIEEDKPNDKDFMELSWNKFIESLSLKQLFIYDKNEIYEKYLGYINQIHLIKRKTINQVVKDFLGTELFMQRTTLIQLLIKSYEPDFQYLAYLLYDLLSNDQNNNIDTQEQTLLFDSFPWPVKKYFRDCMKQTIEYTNNLSNFDNNKIPIEQQICLMKTSDNVKEKAMQKLKEVKSKSDDSGSKARQYLDGLLKIPFGVYKEENILNKIKSIKDEFQVIVNCSNKIKLTEIENREKYNSLEIINILSTLKENSKDFLTNKIKDNCLDKIVSNKNRNELINVCINFNNFLKKHEIKNFKITYSNKNINTIKSQINDFFDIIKNNSLILDEIINEYIDDKTSFITLNNLNHYIDNIESQQKEITDYMINMNSTLEEAVYGHTKAKRQVERIIGQWINGEKTGYCLGFEGPPGVGKTSLAKKGIANCLIDEFGESRPFAFIAMGGSSNGSTFEGHNYTYVGSTWGKIVDILIEKKCMNPIIFIDELDKVSRTEHGKEIIGILTHLIDSSQNDSFQDKYFNGIDLDLSKALFIFSYNDAELIDKILLDRIHRIKFEHLTLDDKLIITKKYILPEIFKKIGLENVIEIPDNVIQFIINYYTYESGVRKLKEILFEILGEINLSILKDNKIFQIPYKVTIDLVKEYLIERHEINKVKINEISKVAVINGLWANALGQGGILHIEANFFPSSTFCDLKLTGMQGDVMKESMTVAKTLAFSLLTPQQLSKINERFEKSKNQGIHIHVPEGSTPKDGPSAGTAITTVIYSLLTNKTIKKEIAITGEICLQGKVTAIGGLDLKILGGLNAGVKTFIYPKENNKDYKLFMDKYKDTQNLDDISFIEVQHISEVLKIVFV
jgi:ATP-dependent Lon protease